MRGVCLFRLLVYDPLAEALVHDPLAGSLAICSLYVLIFGSFAFDVKICDFAEFGAIFGNFIK